MAKSILIPSAVADSTVKRLQRLASKAGVTLEVIPGETKYYRLGTKVCRSQFDGQIWKKHVVDQTKVLVCARVTVGELPATNGYSFVGKIEHTEAGNILAMTQADGLPVATLEEWRTAKPTCDHCGKSRKRAATFLIACPDGSVKRVGRQCLQDFVQADPAQLVNAAAFEDSLRILEESDPDELCSGSGGGHYTIDTLHYIACAARATHLYGFHKRDNQSDARPTSDTAYSACGNRLSGEMGKLWDEMQPTEESVITTIGVLAWLSENTDDSGFMHNLKVACMLPDVRPFTAGLLACAPAMYARAMGEVAAAKAKPVNAGYWGVVGGRASVEVTIVRVINLDSQWGRKTLLGMRTDDGYELVTFSSSSDAPGVESTGKRFEIRGTVKKHEAYKGQPQTALSRVTFTAINATEDQKNEVE